ncbi:hypothetical protein BGW80DRAFT_257035 [Lactifluus volemus]|nr:hypothetical protein BGW80DRAFT_257035 [Lactifluus volemus]
MKLLLRDHSVDPSLAMSMMLLAIILNAYLFGVVSQQFYLYWTSNFKDTKRVKIFVIIQFTVVAFQAVTLWITVWVLFLALSGLALDLPRYIFASIAQSVGQSVLVLSANIFLAIRIHTLTKSRLQTGLVIAFSISAFLVGLFLTYNSTAIMIGIADTMIFLQGVPSALQTELSGGFSLSTIQKVTAVVCYGLQVIAECLIMVFLSWALLKSRSGVQKSDSVVNYLVRRVIQIGFLASFWTIIGWATWFFLPNELAFLLFSATAGPLYTHVIYDTLLSRVQLRKRMGENTDAEIRFSPVEKSETHGGPRTSSLPERTDDGDSFVMPVQSLATDDAQGLEGTVGNDELEVESLPLELPSIKITFDIPAHSSS